MILDNCCSGNRFHCRQASRLVREFHCEERSIALHWAQNDFRTTFDTEPSPLEPTHAEAHSSATLSVADGGPLEVDHITPMGNESDQGPYAPTGLQACCRSCRIEQRSVRTAANSRRKSPRGTRWLQNPSSDRRHVEPSGRIAPCVLDTLIDMVRDSRVLHANAVGVRRSPIQRQPQSTGIPA